MNTTLIPDAYLRHIIGYDFERLERFSREQLKYTYPPFNIEKINESKCVITFAIAGFSADEIDVTLHKNILSVSGKKKEKPDNTTYLYRGLGYRDFERAFTLVEHMKVISADVKDGLLSICLEQIIPEEDKPKKIPIVSNSIDTFYSPQKKILKE